MKGTQSAIGIGFLTAIASSLCCITPILAILAGTTGIASTFQWIDPLRPYLIGLTIAALGFAWYQQLKPVAVDDCGCETTNVSFFKGKLFLGIITLFAALMLAFPYYSGNLFTTHAPDKTISSTHGLAHITSLELGVKGMTCGGCEQHVSDAVYKLDGVIEVTASYKNENTLVKFDSSRTSENQVRVAIASTGYQVTEMKEK